MHSQIISVFHMPFINPLLKRIAPIRIYSSIYVCKNPVKDLNCSQRLKPCYQDFPLFRKPLS